jgi:hypothetical protein
MKLGSKGLAFLTALTALVCIWSHGIAQASGSQDCGQAQGSGCSGRPSTIATQTMPGGRFQVSVLGGGPAFGMPEISEIVRGEPYQAKAVTAIQQTLADGTHIHQTITATVARDSEGRSFRSQKLGVDGPFLAFHIAGNTALSAAEGQAPTLTTIFDPVAMEHIDYTSDIKVARVMPVGRPMRLRSPSVPDHSEVSVSGHAEVGPVMTFNGRDATGGIAAPGEDTGPVVVAAGGWAAEQAESLGKRTIEGVETTGTRRIWTIPVGAIGNDRALVTTEETWYSPKLRLVLLSVRDEPRFGKTTYSLTNLKLTNPDKSLFVVPPGYTTETTAPPSPLPENSTPAPPQ